MPPKSKDRPAEEQLRPFLPLGKYLSADFMKVAEELLFLVSAYGMSKTPTEPKSREQFFEFSANVHDGWKQAQRRVADILIDALNRRDVATANEKEQHRLRSKEGQLAAKRAASLIRTEINVLRRILDTVLWTIFAGEHSTLRRLFVVGGNANLSAKNILDAMPIAERINASPQQMALCTDMLSIVHVGDLLVANRETGKVEFVELKAGDKNYEISKSAEFAVKSGCELFERLATAEFDKTDVKHYERAKRQTKRNQTIVTTIRNEGGVDHNTGLEVSISPMNGAPEFWSNAIVDCFEQMSESKTWAIATIEDCVHVGVYSDQAMAFAGFKSWMATIKCESSIFNLTDSFRDPWMRPLGATDLPFELMKKVFRGDILVIICLDIVRMIEVANKMRTGYLDLASGHDAAKVRAKGVPLLQYKERFVRAKVGAVTSFVGQGMRDRVVFDQHLPSQLLAHHIVTMQALEATNSSQSG